MNRSWGLGLLAAGWLLFGCSRSFTAPPQPAQQPIGTGCASNSACASGQCVDGVCCDHACQASERCDAPGHLGACTARAFGDPCDAGAQCGQPGGACVEGVCCNSPCTDTCHSCTVAGLAGTCAPVADNTDPRRGCADVCSACFSGSCAPALPDTDPHLECGPGQACSVNQTCAITDGGVCSSPADCASGTCIAGACLYLEDEQVNAPQMNPLADARDVAGVANDAEGDLAILFTESEIAWFDDGSGSFAPSLAENEVFLAIRPAGGSWRAVSLYPFNYDNVVAPTVDALGRVVFLGRLPLVIAQREPSSGTCAANENPCGVFAKAVALTGETGVTEVIDRNAANVGYLDAVVDTAGVPSVVWADDRGFHVRKRMGSGDGGWVALADPTTLPKIASGTTPAIQAVGQDLYLVYATSTPGIGISHVDGSGAVELAIGQSGLNCSPLTAFNDESGKGPALADRLVVSVMCDDLYAGDPTVAGGALRAEFMPASSPPWSGIESLGGDLGLTLITSEGEWAGYVHPFHQTGNDASSTTTSGVAWRKPNGQWLLHDLVVGSVGLRPTMAVSGDGAFPFAAFGQDGYDVTNATPTPNPPQHGSTLRAVYIHR